LQRFVRRTAEAAKGTGEAQKALKQLGVDAKKLAKKTPDQALYYIADAMERVESQSQKVRIAFKLFDSEGVAVLNMLEDGSEGLREFQQEAEELGIAVDSMSIDAIERANDAMTRLRSALQGVVNQIVIRLAPAIKYISDQFTQWIKTVDPQKIADDFARGISRIVRLVRDAVAVLTTSLEGWSLAFQTWGEQHWGLLEPTLGEFFENLPDFDPMLEGLYRLRIRLNILSKTLEDGIKNKVRDVVENAKDDLGGLADAAIGTDKALAAPGGTQRARIIRESLISVRGLQIGAENWKQNIAEMARNTERSAKSLEQIERDGGLNR
jgi:hypothetical protein